MYQASEVKRLLRWQLLQERNQIPVNQKAAYDKWVCGEMLQCLQQRAVKRVHAYIPIRSEINIQPVLQELLHQGIEVYCPKALKNRKLEHRLLEGLNKLEEGRAGTLHPDSKIICDGPFDAIIVPGLAFSKNHFRLGYGGGYYDIFLSQHVNGFTLAAFYPHEFIEDLPVEAHDQPLDYVVWKPRW